MDTPRRLRTTLINVRVSADELAMIEALVEHTGLGKSDVLRQGIRSAFAALPLAVRKTVKKDKP